MATRLKDLQVEGSFAHLLGGLKTYHATGRTRPLAWRKQQLNGIIRMLNEHEDRIMDALMKDGGKSEMEAYAGEVGFIKTEAKFALKRVEKWMRPRKTGTPMLLMPGKSSIHYEPYGTVLIITAWNYPIHIALGALIPAVAAGNCAVVKPSEIAPRCSAVLADLLPKYLDPNAVKVVEGGVAETTALLAEPWDKIHYTGSGGVAKIIMKAAAEHLTPVTLELGGKSPCIVDKDADVTVSVRRLVWGKYFNAGQSCIAPDYVLVHKDVQDKFIAVAKKTILDFYGTDPQKNRDYSRIINERHFQRVTRMLPDGEVVHGGRHDASDRYIEPTILSKVRLDGPLMTEEIFGPLMPVVPISSVDEAIKFVNDRPKPLALYGFSSNQRTIDKIIAQTTSGNVSINASMYHAANPNLPFGGVGGSGMGAYHGFHGFEDFSHRKGVLQRGTKIDPRNAYPPFDERTKKIMKKLMG